MPRREQENIYVQRINSVLEHIREHLAEDLSLDVLARVGGFSPFHFHRIFKSITDESVHEAVVRLRLERVSALLRATPKLSITTAAFECGFKSLSDFSRSFKRLYGFSAREWDRQTALKNSKNGKVLDNFPRYTLQELIEFERRGDFTVRLRSLPATRLAYIRVYDSFSDFNRIKEAYHRLVAWYLRKGGNLADTTLYGMSQDDAEVTPIELYRFDWCLSVTGNWEADDGVSLRNFPACRVVSVRCEGDFNEEVKILQYLFRYWLPHSRYQPANLPGMEIYRQHPVEPWETFDLDCAIPIVPL